MFKKEIRAPILALFFMSLGGWMLHFRLHAPGESTFNLVPFLCGLIMTLVLPFLFNYRRTAPWAYLLNMAAVIVGTVTMAYFSLTHWSDKMPVTWENVLLKSTLADILILLTKVPLGEIIRKHYRSTQPQMEDPT